MITTTRDGNETHNTRGNGRGDVNRSPHGSGGGTCMERMGGLDDNDCPEPTQPGAQRPLKPFEGRLPNATKGTSPLEEKEEE